MRIEILYVPGCPNYQPTFERLQSVLASEAVKTAIQGIPVTTEGEAKALLVLLEARGLRVSAEVRARIVGCEDGAQLDAWIRKAVSVGSVDELF